MLLAENGTWQFGDNFRAIYLGDDIALLPATFTTTLLPRNNMRGVDIRSELNPVECTLGEMLQVLQSDVRVLKDGHANLFLVRRLLVARITGAIWNGQKWTLICPDIGEVWHKNNLLFSKQ